MLETNRSTGRRTHARGVVMRRQQRVMQPSLLTRAVDSVFEFVRLAEFEILFVLFFAIAFLLFKDLVRKAVTSPEFSSLTWVSLLRSGRKV